MSHRTDGDMAHWRGAPNTKHQQWDVSHHLYLYRFFSPDCEDSLVYTRHEVQSVRNGATKSLFNCVWRWRWRWRWWWRRWPSHGRKLHFSLLFSCGCSLFVSSCQKVSTFRLVFLSLMKRIHTITLVHTVHSHRHTISIKYFPLLRFYNFRCEEARTHPGIRYLPTDGIAWHGTLALLCLV